MICKDKDGSPCSLNNTRVSFLGTTHCVKCGATWRLECDGWRSLDNGCDEPKDPINPSHYKTEGIECIDAINAALGKDGMIAMCRGNAIKYLWRYGKKGENKEQLEKAKWYIDYALNLLEEK